MRPTVLADLSCFDVLCSFFDTTEPSSANEKDGKYLFACIFTSLPVSLLLLSKSPVKCIGFAISVEDMTVEFTPEYSLVGCFPAIALVDL